MTEERNIKATKDGASATLTASQVEIWKAAGWTVKLPEKRATKSTTRSKKTSPKN